MPSYLNATAWLNRKFPHYFLFFITVKTFTQHPLLRNLMSVWFSLLTGTCPRVRPGQKSVFPPLGGSKGPSTGGLSLLYFSPFSSFPFLLGFQLNMSS